MNIYLVSRFGTEIFSDELNSELESSKDTNLLVRAKTLSEAVELSNALLAKFINEGGNLCNSVIQIGTDDSNVTSTVFHGPFMSNAYHFGGSDFKQWVWQPIDKVWLTV